MSSHVPSTRLIGARPPSSASVPTMTTRVEPPSGLRHSAKRTISGITALTPGVASA